ncbi:MAG: serine/threonine protein kinase [Polyangiaceae bacterium]|nr:serine/threonine protein kinase [Polyangiaceae bacterium]
MNHPPTNGPYDSEAGRVLAGRYRLLAKLGQGGMGSVWRAEHVSLRTPTAVKLIDPSIAQSPEALARFEREAQAAATLRSAHVVQILDYGVDAGTPYIAMELLNGESLAQRLDRRGQLSPQETAVILGQVAKAMTRAHEHGIVHRDLKPDNIFLVREGDEEIAKVLDFGIAKARADAVGGVSTRTGSMLGTPFYMSPEQTAGKRAVDHRTDIWSFAVIAFECLTGTRPFRGESIAEVALAICVEPIVEPSRVGPVPAGFDGWFQYATNRDPDRRFQTIKDAASHLDGVCLASTGNVPAPLPNLPPPQLSDPTVLTGAGSYAATPAPGVRTGAEWTGSRSAPALPQTHGAFSGTAPGLSGTGGAGIAVLLVVLLGFIAVAGAAGMWFVVLPRLRSVSPVSSVASSSESVASGVMSAAPVDPALASPVLASAPSQPNVGATSSSSAPSTSPPPDRHDSPPPPAPPRPRPPPRPDVTAPPATTTPPAAPSPKATATSAQENLDDIVAL